MTGHDAADADADDAAEAEAGTGATSAAVSTSRRTGSSTTPNPAARSRASWQAPSRARPRTASAPARSSSRAATSSSWPICGVSIPISRAGCPRTASKAAASRVSKEPVAWATTVNPGGSQGPGSPSRTTTGRAPSERQAPATASRVSARAAAASRAACTGLYGGVSLVLTRPGTGVLAMTSRCGPPPEPDRLRSALPGAGRSGTGRSAAGARWPLTAAGAGSPTCPGPRGRCPWRCR